MAMTSSASSSSSCGRIDGVRRASIVFPAPGGPTSSTLCTGDLGPILAHHPLESWPEMAGTTHPKAYSYLRFSTPEQSKGDSYRRQTSLAADYAQRHNLELDTQLTFHDLGVSAFRGDNAETGRLADFHEAVRVGLVPQGSYLLVESLDRLSRQTARKAFRALEDICEAGIVVVTLSDSREYTREALDSDPTSLLMSILIFMRANDESATKARRLKAAWVG